MKYTAKEILDHYNLDPVTWKLHEEIDLRVGCCKSGHGEGLSDKASLKNVLQNVNYFELVTLQGTREVDDLWTDNEKWEIQKNLISYIQGLLYITKT